MQNIFDLLRRWRCLRGARRQVDRCCERVYCESSFHKIDVRFIRPGKEKEVTQGDNQNRLILDAQRQRRIVHGNAFY